MQEEIEVPVMQNSFSLNIAGYHPIPCYQLTLLLARWKMLWCFYLSGQLNSTTTALPLPILKGKGGNLLPMTN